MSSIASISGPGFNSQACSQVQSSGAAVMGQGTGHLPPTRQTIYRMVSAALIPAMPGIWEVNQQQWTTSQNNKHIHSHYKLRVRQATTALCTVPSRSKAKADPALGHLASSSLLASSTPYTGSGLNSRVSPSDPGFQGCRGWEVADMSSNTWVPDTHVGELAGVPSSCPRPSLALAAAAIWGVKPCPSPGGLQELTK